MSSTLLPFRKVLKRDSGSSDIETTLKRLARSAAKARDPRDSEDLRNWMYEVVWAALLTERQLKERSEIDWLQWLETSGDSYEGLSGSWKRALCHLLDGTLSAMDPEEANVLVRAHNYDRADKPSPPGSEDIDPVALLRARRNLKRAVASVVQREIGAE